HRTASSWTSRIYILATTLPHRLGTRLRVRPQRPRSDRYGDGVGVASGAVVLAAHFQIRFSPAPAFCNPCATPPILTMAPISVNTFLVVAFWPPWCPSLSAHISHVWDYGRFILPDITPMVVPTSYCSILTFMFLPSELQLHQLDQKTSITLDRRLWSLAEIWLL
ncbi:hypothetical protein C8J57DRAFT_1278280, partial [Mycena rebaudengoi]